MEISFELFPPNTEEGLKNLTQLCQTLQKWQPQYFSVTFGAGGSNQEKSAALIEKLCADKINVAPHLTCLGLQKTEILQLLRRYQTLGIRRLVALRGDLPQQIPLESDFLYAHELVRFIREETGKHFFVEVAAYPEFHPQAENSQVDLMHFKQKVLAGANQAITQYFFNKEAYFRFVESCEQLNVAIPIIPGIMPVRSLNQLVRFSKLCGADIPLWLLKRLEAYAEDEKSLQAFAVEVVSQLCDDLLNGGAPGLHFYTLNQKEPTVGILKNIEHHFNLTAPLADVAR